MPDYDFRTTRLYVDAPLHDGAVVALDRSQSHYLRRLTMTAVEIGTMVRIRARALMQIRIQLAP